MKILTKRTLTKQISRLTPLKRVVEDAIAGCFQAASKYTTQTTSGRGLLQTTQTASIGHPGSVRLLAYKPTPLTLAD
jgi:hypothetical protein